LHFEKIIFGEGQQRERSKGPVILGKFDANWLILRLIALNDIAIIRSLLQCHGSVG
jgi:hypothetical protein